ncbi:MAG: hypothetical protein K6G26_05060 [Lachnospiraceae bacterium]|nr:hypothetical protein [Lachnospiraceae bacterium]
MEESEEIEKSLEDIEKEIEQMFDELDLSAMDDIEEEYDEMSVRKALNSLNIRVNSSSSKQKNEEKSESDSKSDKKKEKKEKKDKEKKEKKDKKKDKKKAEKETENEKIHSEVAENNKTATSDLDVKLIDDIDKIFEDTKDSDDSLDKIIMTPVNNFSEDSDDRLDLVLDNIEKQEAFSENLDLKDKSLAELMNDEDNEEPLTESDENEVYEDEITLTHNEQEDNLIEDIDDNSDNSAEESEIKDSGKEKKKSLFPGILKKNKEEEDEDNQDEVLDKKALKKKKKEEKLKKKQEKKEEKLRKKKEKAEKRKAEEEDEEEIDESEIFKIKKKEKKEKPKKKEKKKDPEKEAAKKAKAEAKAIKKKEEKRKKNEAKLAKKKQMEEEAKKEPKVKINKLGIVVVFTFFGIIVYLVIMGSMSVFYKNALENSRKQFNQGNYEAAYEEIAGLDIKAKDKEYYEKVRVLQKLNMQLRNCDNYIIIDMKGEALNSLISGINIYDSEVDYAKKIGVEKEYDNIYINILIKLTEKFGLTEEKAREIASIHDYDEYTAIIDELCEKD